MNAQRRIDDETLVAETVPHDSRPRQLRLAILSGALFLGSLGLCNALLVWCDLPNYGAWTGIQPLETKLEMLDDFRSEGDVDALMLGSSIVDFGFSAELFSELMTRELGREYRAFNFSTGGAEPRTLPKLYRLARTVAVPKNVFVILPAEHKLGEEIGDTGPDGSLARAPVSEVLEQPWLLALKRRLQSVPFVRNAPAARDYVFHGDFRGVVRAMGGLYPLSAHGDRVSYRMTWQPDKVSVRKQAMESSIRPFPGGSGRPDNLNDRLQFYFAETDIRAFKELRELVEQDGGNISVVVTAQASTFHGGPSQNDRYRRASRDFFQTIAEQLHATLVDPTDLVDVPLHHVSDLVHLNKYGAEIFTRAVFARMTNKTPVQAGLVAEAIDTPPAGLFPTGDRTFNKNSAVVVRPAGAETSLLRFRTMQAVCVHPLPEEELIVAVRTPQNEDILAHAARLGPSDFVAELKLPPNSRPEALVLRLLWGEGARQIALETPLTDYEWVTSYPRIPISPQSPALESNLLALPTTRAPGERVYLAAARDARLPPSIDARLVSRSGDAGRAIKLGQVESDPDSLLALPLPQNLPEGDYEIQFKHPVDGRVVARTQPLTVAPSILEPPQIRLAAKPQLTDAELSVNWSGIRRPHPEDWVGLFPADAGENEGAKRIGRPIFLSGQRSGTTRFPLQSITSRLNDGEYQLRLYASGKWRLLAETEPFRFLTPPSEAQLHVEAAPDLSTGTLIVRWDGITDPRPDDWIGLFPASGAESTRLRSVRLKGQVAGEIAFPVPVSLASPQSGGEYEFRLYAAGGWVELARSGRIRLTTGGKRPVRTAVRPNASTEIE